MRTYESLNQPFEFHYHTKLLYRIYAGLLLKVFSGNCNFITPASSGVNHLSLPGTKQNDQIIQGMVEI